uniref:IP16038p n=1 Tax=Drosophila melanogaster TaxID=7227 RepID=Q1WWG4_DROME|nr:IP16038p [Drosophila melanogaster]
MTAITYTADQVLKNEKLRPRVGVGKNCWIYTGDMTVMIYFYGPMLLLIAFNIIMFVLSAIYIYNIKKNVKGLVHKQQTNQQINDQQMFAIFLRLFILMGLSWSFEIVSFLLTKQQAWARSLMVADYFNWSQGTIIFVLFILKPSILKLIIAGGRQNLPGSHHNSRSKAARYNSTHTACEGSIADPNAYC